MKVVVLLFLGGLYKDRNWYKCLYYIYIYISKCTPDGNAAFPPPEPGNSFEAVVFAVEPSTVEPSGGGSTILEGSK